MHLQSQQIAYDVVGRALEAKMFGWQACDPFEEERHAVKSVCEEPLIHRDSMALALHSWSTFNRKDICLFGGTTSSHNLHTWASVKCQI